MEMKILGIYEENIPNIEIAAKKMLEDINKDIKKCI
jgi:hypothetical protein